MSDVFFITGEASGDAVAAGITEELRVLSPDIAVEGVGGSRMRSAGVSVLVDSSRWGAIGVAQAFPLIARVLTAAKSIRTHLKHNPPVVLVPIDFGAFNTRMGRWARSRGIRVVYAMPPGSWRRNPKPERLQNLAGCADVFLSPFRWNADNLAKVGAVAHHIGHPVLDMIAQRQDRSGIRDRYVSGSGRLIALLPGSRTHEVGTLLPRMLEVAKRWLCDADRWVIVKAPSVRAEWLSRILADSGASHVGVYEGRSADVLAACDAAVVCSGTATLEAAALGTPMVVVYDGSPVLRAEYRLRKRGIAAPMVAMPNIILDRMAAPELLMEHATARNIRTELIGLLDDPVRRAAILSDFADVRRALEPEGAFRAAAHHILEAVMQ